MIPTPDAQAKLAAEFGIAITAQTIRNWVKSGVVPGFKLGGRYYVDWDALVRMLHSDEDTPQE